MTGSAVVLVQSTFARSACARLTARDLRDGVERACELAAGEARDRKAAAHAELHRLLPEATGASGFALPAQFINGGVHDIIAQAGPPAEDLIVTSRRLIGHLEARDADSAAREKDHLPRLCQQSLRSCSYPQAETTGNQEDAETKAGADAA